MADQSKDNPPNKPPVERRNPLATIGRGVVPPVLQDAHSREQVGVPADEDAYGDYMIELNIQYSGGLRAAAIAFRSLYETVLESVEPGFVKTHPPIEISKSYFQCFMCVKHWRALLAEDEKAAAIAPSRRVIYKLWPDFKVNLLMDRSIATVKADAAFRSYAATGSGITSSRPRRMSAAASVSTSPIATLRTCRRIIPRSVHTSGRCSGRKPSHSRTGTR